MKNHVFDQSIVGIFPKDNAKIYYLLALMNSDVINDLIHAINPTANNSSNYIKQIPYMEPAEEVLSEITFKVCELISLEEAAEYDAVDALHNEINSIIGEIYF